MNLRIAAAVLSAIVALPAAVAASHGLPYDDELAAWLPKFPEDVIRWRNGQATRTAAQDWFEYHSGPAPARFIQIDPLDGTFFAYGQAGPPKVHVVYDWVHRIVFYSEGCCSWGHTVAAAAISPPPHPVVSRNLSNFRTHEGIALGDSPAKVKRVFGPAQYWPVGHGHSLRELSYYTPQPERDSTPCLWTKNFYFSRDRLIIIEFAHGC